MLDIRELTKSYAGLPVLGGLTFTAAPGDILAVLGPSGCGKTTLLRILAGLTPSGGGTVRTGGARTGYIFQEDRLLPWLTAAENTAAAAEKSDPAEVRRLLASMGLAGFEEYYPSELSGGMRQRCAFARACHFHCDILLMDEPFRSLDAGTRRDMLTALLRLREKRGITVVLVTHDIDEALAAASKILVLTGRPARAAAEFGIGPPEDGRDIHSPDMQWIRQEIHGLLGGALGWGGGIPGGDCLDHV